MNDRQRWNERHRGGPARAAPSAFVARHVAALEPQPDGGFALDLACGAGRHAEILARRGFRTIGLDHAAAACHRIARELPAVLPVVGDASALPLAPGRFAVVVQTLFLERSIFPRLADLLAPGGRLLVETFLLEQHRRTGHPRADFCLRGGELAHLCTAAGVDLHVLEAREGPVEIAGKEVHLASIVACKQ